MGIPIIQELWDGIRWLIDFFMTKTPRVIQLMFFLILLLLFGAIIPFMLHTFGIHCNYEGDVVRTSPLSIVNNVKLALIDSEQIYNKSSFVPENIGIEGSVFSLLPDVSCRRHICYDGTRYVYAKDDYCDNRTKQWIFIDKQFEWSRCIVCDGDSNFTTLYIEIDNDFSASETKTFCFGDAYPIDDDDKNWFQSWVCNPDQRCVPPENYYYESDTGTYDCIDDVSCGQNETDEIIPLIDQELLEADAELLYKNQKNDYTKVVMFQCNTDTQPTITFFGLPIFDYRAWLIIFLVAVMFIFLRNIRKH